MLFCLCFFSIWFEFSSGSTIETAEYLVIFQTKYLDTNDQALHSQTNRFPKIITSQLRTACFCTCQHQDNTHHGSMADSESTDTDKGQGIGEITKHNFEQFKESLYEEHCLSSGMICDSFSTSIGKRFFEKITRSGITNISPRQWLPAVHVRSYKQQISSGQHSVKYQSATAFVSKNAIFQILRRTAVDDMKIMVRS